MIREPGEMGLNGPTDVSSVMTTCARFVRSELAPAPPAPPGQRPARRERVASAYTHAMVLGVRGVAK